MCLCVPAEVVEVLGKDKAKISVGGIVKEASLALWDEPRPPVVGDMVLFHVGFVLGLIDPDETAATLERFAETSVQAV